MKYLKMLGLGALAATALTAFAASTASATTLEIGGVPQNKEVTISASLKTGTSAVLRTTGEAFANTCTESTVHGETTAPYTNTTYVTGPITTLTFDKCTEEPVTVDKPGKLYVHWESGTNGTVFSEEAEVTVPTPFGKVNCKTGTGTKIGTLTGVASGNATMHINGVLNCGFLLPSAVWTGTYTVTSPSGLGVVN